MNIMNLIPNPDAIPVEWGWFKFFLLFSFMAHILLVNVVIGSALIAFFSNIGNGAQGRQPENVEKDLSAKLPFFIAFAVNFGIVPFLFLQVLYGQFIYVSSILMATFWISTTVLLIVSYYSAYIYKYRFDSATDSRIYFIGAAAFIFLVIGFIFSNMMTLMLSPNSWTEYFENPRGTILNLSDPVLIPRYLHFVVASIAVGGLFLALLGYLDGKKGRQGAGDQIRCGMKWFSYATLVQIPIGCWFLVSLPRDVMMLFMGHERLPTLVFLFSIALLIAVVWAGFKNRLFFAGGTLLALVMSMIVMRDMVRTAYLSPFFHPRDLEVTAQYSPMLLFLSALVISLAVIAYVIRCSVETTDDSNLIV